MPVSYDRRAIAEWLDAHTLAKARDYAHAVCDLRWAADHTLTGKVQGTRRRPYEVEVEFHDTGGNMWADGDCTCPVEYNCKHVAAVLVAGMALQPMPPAAGVWYVTTR